MSRYGMAKEFTKIDNVEHQKRIYQVSLLLRRKPMAYIIEFIKSEWDIESAQAYNYVKEAREEWKKYFAKLKKDGMSYHVTQLRDLKDQAYSQKKVIGKEGKQKVVKVPNLPLILDIAKEEAKLMGTYPANKIDISDVNVKFELVSADKEEDKESEKDNK